MLLLDRASCHEEAPEAEAACVPEEAVSHPEEEVGVPEEHPVIQLAVECPQKEGPRKEGPQMEGPRLAELAVLR